MTVLAVSHAQDQFAGDKYYTPDPTPDPTPMTAEAFLGQWKDTIGHDVYVKISDEGLLVATLTKPEGGKPKELCIHMDHYLKWRCGNGVLHSPGMVYRTDSKQWEPLALSWITWNGKKSTWTRCAERNEEVKTCKDSEASSSKDSEADFSASGRTRREKDAWWKMTEEWDAEITTPTKEDGRDVEAKAATRPIRRSRHGRRGAHQSWRKVGECKA